MDGIKTAHILSRIYQRADEAVCGNHMTPPREYELEQPIYSRGLLTLPYEEQIRLNKQSLENFETGKHAKITRNKGHRTLTLPEEDFFHAHSPKDPEQIRHTINCAIFGIVTGTLAAAGMVYSFKQGSALGLFFCAGVGYLSGLGAYTALPRPCISEQAPINSNLEKTLLSLEKSLEVRRIIRPHERDQSL